MFGLWKRKRSAESPLLWLNDRDTFTLHQAYAGVLGLGGTGSGKSSSLVHLMFALMRRNCGMLFLTAKGDDWLTIQEIARVAHREVDLVRFAPGERWRLDFLNYELKSLGGSVQTAGQLMQDLADHLSHVTTSSSNEPFWALAAARKILMALIVLEKAQGRVGIADVYRFCTSMPRSAEERGSEAFRATFCCRQLVAASQAWPEDEDLALAVEYCLKEYPLLGEKTAASIDANVLVAVDKFMHGSVRELVASEVTNVSPDDVLNGKIVVVDMPVLKYREPGVAVQMAWKLLTLRACLRRTLTPESRPVCVWCDEAQMHALASVDSMTQAVARSHLLINVAITQNIPLLQSVIKRREDVLAWINNLSTWFTFANPCKETNEICSARAGYSKHLFGTSSGGGGQFELFDDVMGMEQAGSSYSMTEHWHPDLPPESWHSLRTGAAQNNNLVDCYVLQNGRFSNGKNWIKTTFKQR